MEGHHIVISSKALARKIFVPFLATLMVAGLSAGFASPAKADNVSNTVTIHYQDPAATDFDSYKGWNLWLFKGAGTSTDTAQWNVATYFNGSDSFGKSYTFTVSDSATLSTIGTIVRTNAWDKKEWNAPAGQDKGNRFIALDSDGSTEVWIVAGTDKAAYYTSLADAQDAGAGSAPWEAGATDPNYDCADGVCTPVSTASNTQALTIHYQGKNVTGFNSYRGWDVCIYNFGDFACHNFNGEDAYGKVFKKNLTGTKLLPAIGIIIRKNDWSTRASCAQCTGDGDGNHLITLDPSGTTEVWVLDGSDGPFFSSKADAEAAGAVSAPWEAGASDPNYSCTGTGFDAVCQSLISYSSSQTIRIHYNRPAGDYDGWNIWYWNIGTGGQLDFSGEDAYGKVATLTVNNTAAVSGFGFLLRSSDNWDTATKNGLDGNGNQDSVTFTSVQDGAPSGAGTVDVYVKQGKKAVYSSNPYGAPTLSGSLPTTTGGNKTFEVSGTNFPTDGSVRANLVRAAVPAVLATKVGNVYKCGSVTRSQGYVCTAAVPAATAPAVARALSATKLSVSLAKPTSAITGKLVVTTPGGSATSTGSIALTTANNLPSAPVASPAAGLVGDTVTVTATNAGAATAVKLGTLSVDFTVTAINKLTFVVPAGAEDGKISITTAGGTASSSALFRMKPVISSLSPSSVAVGGIVTINGANLAGVTAVKMGTKVLVKKTAGATSITYQVPAGTVTGKVSVTTPGGTVTSADDLTIIPAPSITAVTGTKGTGANASKFVKGTTMTITGTNLTGATAVRIGANTIAEFTVVSSTQITFTAPTNKTGTSVSVVTPGGTATKSGTVATTA